MGLPPALILAGPTAAGKSSIALDIAEAVGGEIVSADSRQVYRGLDIGTAKPSAAERARVRHHLVDIRNPGASYSAGRFLHDARAVLADLADRKAPAIVVGGSTLYVHALVEGLADLPPVPEAVVADLTDVAKTASGREALFNELSAADPEAAATLDPTKSQRLVRLVGLLRTAEFSPSTLWREAHEDGIPHRLVVLTRNRPDLYEAIDRRVDSMCDAGLMGEARELSQRGPEARKILEATIGYREWLPVFTGDRSPEAAVALIKRNTRRYAKRQLTWYRRYPEATWIDADTASALDVLERVAPWPSIT